MKRRRFLEAAAAVGGGLALGVRPDGRVVFAETLYDERDDQRDDRRLGPWVRIDDDGVVTIYIEKSEMGQGIHTALAMLVAEELEVAWENVAVEPHVLEGRAREVETSSSDSVRTSFEPLRRAGAAAREMLVAAAATRFGVTPSACTAENGVVRCGDRALPYSELAAAAAALPVPPAPRLKAAGEARLIGRSLARVDVPGKVDGSARFGIDVELEGLLYAAVRMSPVLGGELAGLHEGRARALPGVEAVVPVPGGVVVVADRYMRAINALDALAPAFEGGAVEFDSDLYAAELRVAVGEAGVRVGGIGDADAAFAAAERIVEATYEVPFLAHATMEPMNCTARVQNGACEIWAPTQAPSAARRAAADALGLPLRSVRVHTTLLGGGFGRRIETDFVVQAVLAARVTVGRPVKLIWSREEDTRHDYYRPAFAARLRAGLDAGGHPVAWEHRIAGPSHSARDSAPWLRAAVAWAQQALGSGLVPEATPKFVAGRFPRWVRTGRDAAAVGGAGPLAYAIPAQAIDYALVDAPVPVGWWRSVGNSQNVFFIESFVDEIAAASGSDPLTLRRVLLADEPRALRVLGVATRAAGWGTPTTPGVGRGLAICTCYGSWVAQIAVVSAVSGSEEFRVERVTCAVDCGRVVNPDGVRAQIEGAIVFGLSAALRAEIQIRKGRVVQSNFHDLQILGLAECPEIDVHLVASDAPPGGAGELGTPPVAPAVANALHAATGRRVRRLPLARGDA